MAHQIDFVFDIVSPYSYLAFNLMERYRGRWSDVDITYTPAFLGGVFAGTRNAPPATLPAKAPYLMRDLGRCSAYYDVPLAMPPNFPSKTIRAQRALTDLKAKKHSQYISGVDALFRRYWATGEAWNDSAEEIVLCLQGAGFDDAEANAAAERSSDDDVKAGLKAHTESAIERGAFGFPAIFAKRDGSDDEEMYFGADRIEVLAFELGLKWDGPVPGR